MGLLTKIGGPSTSLQEILEKEFGPFRMLGESFLFDYTNYYEKEFGKKLWRTFLLFENLIDPSSLASIKIKTNSIEQENLEEGNRTFNLDPGILTSANIILATTKNRSHRIPLQQGIYGELTLMYQGKKYNDFQWTYPDYKEDKVKHLFEEVRKEFLKQLSF
jgi:hypothetical protein